MAFEIPEHFSQSFTENVELLLQQKESRLGRSVTMAPYEGESAQVVKQFGEVEFEEAVERHGDTNFSDIDHKQRWVFPTDYDLALPVSKQDEIRQLGSPTSPYVAAMQAAWNRKIDAVVAASYFGTARTGKNGATSTAFDTNNVVSVSAGAAGATGLNLEKLTQVIELARGNEIDEEEELFIAIGKKQLSDLLRTTEVTHKDYSTVQALVDGKMTGKNFMGLTWLPVYNKLPVDGSGYRRIPVYTRDAIHVGMWNSLQTMIGPRPDKKYITQVYMEGTLGGTRTQEGKVYEIKCSE